MIDRTEQNLLRALTDGLPLSEDPFGDVAERIGLEREDLLLRIQSLLDRGVIRRFGARINQREVGIGVNAMVAWKVPVDRIEEVGRLLASHPEVTHCYERAIVPARWEYNLYTVLHAYDEDTVFCYTRELSASTGIREYLVLFSTEEFKRAPAGRIIESVQV
jgi:DNA-binding Lrp family transcriptional regulator